MLLGLYRSISSKRKRQLALVFLLMIVGVLAEIMTLGTIVPFIAVMIDPSALSNYPFVERIFPGISDMDGGSLRLYFALAFSGAALLASLTRVVLTFSYYNVVHGLGNDIATRVYFNILHQPYAYHLKTNSSKIVAAFHNVQLLIQEVVFSVVQGAVSVVLAVFILGTLIVIAPGVALSALLGFGVIFGVSRLLTERILGQVSETIARMQSKRIQAVLEGVGSIRDVIIDRTQSLFVSRFHDYDQRYQSAFALNRSVSKAPRYIVEGLGMALIAFIALYLTSQPGGALAALPLLGAVALGAQRLLPLAQDIYESWAHIAGTRDITSEVLGLLNMPVDKSYSVQVPDSKAVFEKDIVFDDVSFHYDGETDLVLKELSFTIPKGSVVGLVGETGSGKSTLADLVLGLLRPTSGVILIDGQPLDQNKLTQWHRRISHVPQSIFLSDASIEQNIALGVEPQDIDKDLVREVARLAKLDAFVETLPQGYQTEVGERGARLSGGQVQRIGISRALYKRPDVLVLDEATSALDTQTETGVMDALHDVAKTTTVIIIAHRLSTLSFCDTVLRLNKGQLVETDEVVRVADGSRSGE